VAVKEFGKCCTFDEMAEKEHVKEVWNVGSEHGSVRNKHQTEDWNCEENECLFKFAI
jgi:hypothetical protein